MLDRATWRRFQITLEWKDRAGRSEEVLRSAGKARPAAARPGAAAATLDGASYADAATLCDDVERQQLLHPEQDPDDLFRRRLARWAAARRNHPQRPEQRR